MPSKWGGTPSVQWNGWTIGPVACPKCTSHREIGDIFFFSFSTNCLHKNVFLKVNAHINRHLFWHCHKMAEAVITEVRVI